MTDTLNVKLRREPTELLTAVRHFYGSKLDHEIRAAMPVMLRPSIESTLVKIALVGVPVAILVCVASLLFPNSSLAFLLGLMAVVLYSMFSPKSLRRDGVVVVTDNDYILIGLEKDRLETGQILQRIERTTPLPKPTTHKGGIIGGPLPFDGEANAGWYYAAGYYRGLQDRGVTYLDLIEGLRTARTENQFAESV